MRRVYTGIEISSDMKLGNKSKFKAFGELSNGRLCYHKLKDNTFEELEGCWYSKFRKNGKTYFILEAYE